MNAPCATAPITPATVGKKAYERHRRRQIAYGRWQPETNWVNPDSARAHLEHLRRHGVGRVTAAKQAGVAHSTVFRILTGRTAVIAADVESRILAVTTIQTALVDACGARRRLQALVADGHTQSALAKAIGWRVNNLNTITLGKRGQLTPDTYRAIYDLYERSAGALVPDSYGARRSRRLAAKRGWAPSAAWTPDSIDDPNGHPVVGDGVDPVLVDRVLHGFRSYSDLNSAEQVSLWSAWERHRRARMDDGPGLTAFGRTFGVTEAVATRLRAAAGRAATNDSKTATAA